MPGTPERKDDEHDHKADAARGLFKRAELVVDESDAACWKVSGGGQPSAQPYLFWPATGTFRRPDGTRGYGPAVLISEIRKAGGS